MAEPKEFGRLGALDIEKVMAARGVLHKIDGDAAPGGEPGEGLPWASKL